MDLEQIVTPVKVNVVEKLLRQSNYDKEETEFLIKGFKEGFDIEYEGEPYRQHYAQNIPFRSVGSSEELWEKLMKEV